MGILWQALSANNGNATVNYHAVLWAACLVVLPLLFLSESIFPASPCVALPSEVASVPLETCLKKVPLDKSKSPIKATAGLGLRSSVTTPDSVAAIPTTTPSPARSSAHYIPASSETATAVPAPATTSAAMGTDTSGAGRASAATSSTPVTQPESPLRPQSPSLAAAASGVAWTSPKPLGEESKKGVPPPPVVQVTQKALPLIPNEAAQVSTSGTLKNSDAEPKPERSLHAVTLHVYDVSKEVGIQQLNAFLSLLPFKLGGVFHAGVEVLGREWSFGYCERGSGVSAIPPRGHSNHTFRESIAMPCTTLAEAQVKALIQEMSSEYNGSSYHLLRRNCCHFADDLCQRLGVGAVPPWLHRFARLGDGVLNISQDLEYRLGSRSVQQPEIAADDAAETQPRPLPSLLMSVNVWDGVHQVEGRVA